MRSAIVPVRNRQSTKACKGVGDKAPHSLDLGTRWISVHRLRVFHTHLLSKLFGSNMEELIRGYRNLLNEYLHNLYSAEYCHDQQIKKD